MGDALTIAPPQGGYARVAGETSIMRTPLPLTAIAAVAACLVLASPPTFAQAPGAAPQVVFVVDGSGSMWGGLGGDGVAKIAGVRRVLEANLPQLASNPVGLVTFGPGCRSSELAAPPATGTAETVLTALARFNPRGKGPVVAGLEAAAQTFTAGTGGHIVLFHDGVDNCGQNACAAADALRKSHPGVAVHTVSLGLEKAELQGMSCVAKSTGGRSFAVADQAALDAAMTNLAGLVAPTGGAPVAAPGVTGQPAPPPPAAEPAAPKGPPRLVATATLAAGKPPVSSPLVWRVLDPANGSVLAEAVAPSLAAPLRPGKARIEVLAGKHGVTREVDIAETGDTVAEITLDAGLVRIETGARKLANEAEEPLIRLDRLADIAAAGAAEASGPTSAGGAVPAPRGKVSTPLWIARGTAAEAILPPGSYRAVAEFGLAQARANIDVTAGSEASVQLALEAGRLELTTSGKAAGPASYTITVDDPSLPGGQRVIARSAHPAASFILSTGSYAVTASIDGRDTRRVVAVRQGEVTREAFGDDLGHLTVTATHNGKPADRLSIVVTPLALPGDSGIAAISGRPLALPAGRHRVTLRQHAGGPSLIREVVITSGQEQRIALDLASAELSVNARAGSGRGGACALRGDDGTTLWRSVELDGRALLSPGRYALACTSGSVSREKSVTLTAGARVAVDAFAP